MTTELKPIPLVVQPSNRDRTTTKDAKLVNCVIERQPDGTVHVTKRPGITYISHLVGDTMQGLYAASNIVYGVYYNNTSGHTDLYQLVPGVGAIPVYTLSTTPATGPDGRLVGWYFSANRASSRQILVTGGALAFWINGLTGVVTPIASFTPSTAWSVGPTVYLDGITYVLDNDGKIWNSNVNDVTTWNALNFIQAQSDSDTPLAIQKQLTYIIVFKDYSIEVFYNANKPQGSPLARNDSAKISHMGLYDRDTLVRVNDTLLWVSQSRAGGISISKMVGLSAEIISTPNIDRLLADNWDSGGSLKAFGVRLDGHDLYVVTIGTPGITFVYDITEGAWYQWTDSSGNAMNFFGAVTNRYSYHLNPPNTGPTLYGATDGNVYNIAFNVNHDSSSTSNRLIPVDIYTPLWDQGVRLKKYCNKLEVHGDQQSAGTVNIYTTDDDYKTWVGPRSVDLSDGVATSPNWGTFRRRGWHLSHLADTPFRVTSLVAHIMLGTS